LKNYRGVAAIIAVAEDNAYAALSASHSLLIVKKLTCFMLFEQKFLRGGRISWHEVKVK
jgi:hypothetical protein